ncbi:MAG TPA: trypsin-like peptidase domain-containing protein [Thermoanaerobaculia bacterium]|nr:trypsin-like peptidase domain-containing protein [Thermoanaerobaculia bacterium]
MNLTIRHLSGSQAGQDQRLTLQEGQALRLGRNPGSDVKFNDELDDSVSGVHAELSLQGGRLYIEDKRSTNGTYVNGAPSPPFQRIAVPPESRIRLGKEGPEMQLFAEPAPAAAGGQEPAAAAPFKEAVGRATLRHEIDRARQEERHALAGRIADSRKSTRRSIVVALIVVLLAALGVGGAAWWGWRKLERQRAQAADATRAAGANVWADIERRVGPAVVHVRCSYRVRIPIVHSAVPHYARTGGDILAHYAVQGSGVVIRPGLVLTAKHVGEPWLVQFPGWPELVSKYGAKAEYDLFDVQFAGRQPVQANLVASSSEFDLALLQVQPATGSTVPIVGSNEAVKVTDPIAVISYPGQLGQSEGKIENVSGFGGEWSRVTQVAPTFVLGNVSHSMTGPTGSHYVHFEAGITHGSSGGAVVNDRGELIGIISSESMEKMPSIHVGGQAFMTLSPIPGGKRAVSPDDILSFLRTYGF